MGRHHLRREHETCAPPVGPREETSVHFQVGAVAESASGEPSALARWRTIATTFSRPSEPLDDATTRVVAIDLARSTATRTDTS